MSFITLLPNTYRAFYGRFSSLTLAQKKVISPILAGQDLVLVAGTGSGKTEAVLAPVTERRLTSQNPFSIIYIVPTRALAFDLYERISSIYETLDVKVGIRTGDGKTSSRHALDLIILTPESLDVFLGSSDIASKKFLRRVQVVIIDEVHQFLHTPRGVQLSCLLHRLRLKRTLDVQVLLMSATIPSVEQASSAFVLKNPYVYREESARIILPHWVHIKDLESELSPFFDDLYHRYAYRKILVFVNSRKMCEDLFRVLQGKGVFSEHIVIHYSNLSSKNRQAVELLYKKKRICICIATSTLEVGVDIGDIDAVVLMGPPPSGSAFVQRIGRACRRSLTIHVWGICYGVNAHMELLQFLALHQLAQNNVISNDHYSVFFQQILSCLHEKKTLSLHSLCQLFPEKASFFSEIIPLMLRQHWLKEMNISSACSKSSSGCLSIYTGGWKFFKALTRLQIWSNFPQNEDEYTVILDGESIATLPFSTVQQLEIGNCIQLFGKVVKIVSCDEKKTRYELVVSLSDQIPDTEIQLYGLGAGMSYDVAQKIFSILHSSCEQEGLFLRTKKLLQQEKERFLEGTSSTGLIRVRRMENQGFRYDTFLGYLGNFILYHAIKIFLDNEEYAEIHFDALGIECSHFVAFSLLLLPTTKTAFDQFIFSHLPSFLSGFAWNSWLSFIPKQYQCSEISAALFDQRILDLFALYKSESMPQCPKYTTHKKIEPTVHIGVHDTFQLYIQKNISWKWMDLSPAFQKKLPSSYISVAHLQRYIAYGLCPYMAQLQQYENVPLLQHSEKDWKSFSSAVFQKLQQSFEFEECGIHAAIQKALIQKNSFFISHVAIEDHFLHGWIDLLHISYVDGQIFLTIYQIINGYTVSYAHRWNVALCSHIVKEFLRESPFFFTVEGGVFFKSLDREAIFEKESFDISVYSTKVKALLVRWKADSMLTMNLHTIEEKCASCTYFPFCYQKTLSVPGLYGSSKSLSCIETETVDFPKNTQQWFCIEVQENFFRWQIWEKGAVIQDTCLHIHQFPSFFAYKETVQRRFSEDWKKASAEKKYPHHIVYDKAAWYSPHNCRYGCGEWTSIESVLRKHFSWPDQGRLNPSFVASCIGIQCADKSLVSLYHKEPYSDQNFSLYFHIWNWVLKYVKSMYQAPFENDCSVPCIMSYIKMHHKEIALLEHDITQNQKRHYRDRLASSRALGPLRFVKGISDGRSKVYYFSLPSGATMSCFREGDFLKLSFLQSTKIQEGFSVLLESYEPDIGEVSVRPLKGKIYIHPNEEYILDEEISQKNDTKILNVLTRLKDPCFNPEIIRILYGQSSSFPKKDVQWAESWLMNHASSLKLNDRQKEAFLLPFRRNIGIIEGPPGTGKTYVLAWTVVALIAHANANNMVIKILITAQTHQAIDHILQKIALLFEKEGCPKIPLWKYGKTCPSIESLRSSDPCLRKTSFVLGSTGYGVYQLFEEKSSLRLFDWVVIDEASQMLPHIALLSLPFGKKGLLLYGDTQQLPPIIRGNYEGKDTVSSILSELRSRSHQHHCVRLNESYRMNDDICRFVSNHWYENDLHAKVPEQKITLVGYPNFFDSMDTYLDPDKPLVSVQLVHDHCHECSIVEAEFITKAVIRLIQTYGLSSNQIGIISPHRSQNTLLKNTLKTIAPELISLPKIDTVERMQGLEFDVVFFSATVSDINYVHTPFIRDYRRFNVSISRARKKFLFVASYAFFQTFPDSEAALHAAKPFDDFQNLFSSEQKMISSSIKQDHHPQNIFLLGPPECFHR